MADPPPGVRDLLERHPWETTIPALVAYARGRIGYRSWGGQRGGSLPAGKEAEDVVYEAIEKVLSGRRSWDPEAKPDLVQFLKDVIESDVHHLAVGFENRRIVGETEIEAGREDGVRDRFLDTVQSPGSSPAEALLRREVEEEGREFASAFLATLDRDPVLKAAVACIFDGVVKPADISERTGLTVEEIYNVRKRLQRRLMDYYAEWGKKHEPERGRWRP